MVDEIVQGQASVAEPVQTTEPVTPPAEGQTPPVSTPEKTMDEKIAEAVAKALAPEIEKSKREIQSTKDRATAEIAAAHRRAKLAETVASATQRQIQSLDPETAKELELAQLRAERSGRQSLEQEEAARLAALEFHQNFQNDMTQLAEGLGIDPKDSRIDWANDSPNYLEAQKRVHASLIKIQKENAKNIDVLVEAKSKEIEKRIKASLNIDEVNSVSTQMSGGVSADSGIPTDMSKFRTWVSDLSSAEYKKLKPEIDKLLSENKIK